ncbi:polysaccharide lyase family 8 super-sandwich domain-containing protein [Photobacterium leiognathi]|uniref:polysaccharide lyase family 8 super-sandwich domain-containing protein n=1 Tax=Photobacterium leiognathi TaxID=553611 RepID=UPI002738AF23|nr:polysaccharide lyase family 8 super-sandwich domain-containing protein [Photobacterium leiognathi]
MRFFLTACMMMMMAVGCDNRSDIDVQERPPQSYIISGSAVKAPWVNAQVQLYELDLSNPDFLGRLVTTGKTDLQAKFEGVTIPDLTRHYMLVVNTTEETVELGNNAVPMIDTMYSFLPANAFIENAQDINLIATPLTTMAVKLAIQNADLNSGLYKGNGDGITTESEWLAALDIATDVVKSLMGYSLVDDIDIYTQTPVVVHTSSEENKLDALHYRLAIEATGSLIQHLATNNDTNTLFNDVLSDMADGKIEGAQHYQLEDVDRFSQTLMTQPIVNGGEKTLSDLGEYLKVEAQSINIDDDFSPQQPPQMLSQYYVVDVDDDGDFNSRDEDDDNDGKSDQEERNTGRDSARHPHTIFDDYAKQRIGARVPKLVDYEDLSINVFDSEQRDRLNQFVIDAEAESFPIKAHERVMAFHKVLDANKSRSERIQALQDLNLLVSDDLEQQDLIEALDNNSTASLFELKGLVEKNNRIHQSLRDQRRDNQLTPDDFLSYGIHFDSADEIEMVFEQPFLNASPKVEHIKKRKAAIGLLLAYYKQEVGVGAPELSTYQDVGFHNIEQEEVDYLNEVIRTNTLLAERNILKLINLFSRQYHFVNDHENNFNSTSIFVFDVLEFEGGEPLAFVDANLAQCVKDTAFENGWHLVNEITSLNCSNLEINNITGLEVLTGLKELDLSDNTLTEVNVSSLSELVSLNLASNQLMSLDLSNQPYLERLVFMGNPLSEMVLEQNSPFNRPMADIRAIERTNIIIHSDIDEQDDDKFSYSWQQLSGIEAELTNTETANLAVNLPALGEKESDTLAFSLTTTSNTGLVSVSTVFVNLFPIWHQEFISPNLVTVVKREVIGSPVISYQNDSDNQLTDLLITTPADSPQSTGVSYRFHVGNYKTIDFGLSLSAEHINSVINNDDISLDIGLKLTNSGQYVSAQTLVLKPNEPQSLSLQHFMTEGGQEVLLEIQSSTPNIKIRLHDIIVGDHNISPVAQCFAIHTPDEDIELDFNAEDLLKVKTAIYNTKVGENYNPTDMSNVDNYYNAFNFSLDSNNQLTSNKNFSSYGELRNIAKTLAAYLKNHPDDIDYINKANNLIRYLSEQVCRGDFTIPFYGIDDASDEILLLSDHLSEHVKTLFSAVLSKESHVFKYLWMSDKQYGLATKSFISTDDVYLRFEFLIPHAFLFTDENKIHQQLAAVQRFSNRVLTHSPTTFDGIKPDGTTFHHWSHHPSYLYSYKSLIEGNIYLIDTQYKIPANKLNNLLKAASLLALTGNDNRFSPLSLSGRGPTNRLQNISSAYISKLNQLELDSIQPVDNSYTATLLKFVYPNAAPLNGGNEEVYPMEGVYQFNYANYALLRHKDWLVVNKGQSRSLWGAEIYSNANRFGRYQSYGTQEVIYHGSKLDNGYNHRTWNWNYNPGATTIVLPWVNLLAEFNRVDEYQEYGFAGALSFKRSETPLIPLKHVKGDIGLFAMNFKEKEKISGWGAVYYDGNKVSTVPRDKSFSFKKSSFYFEDLIINLGSNITAENSSEHPVVTTLYQRQDSGLNNINVNGIADAVVDDSTYDVGNMANQWLIDNSGTGFYFVHSGAGIMLQHTAQQVPQHNSNATEDLTNNPIESYHLGYINHGINPTHGEYEYLLFPATSQEKMTTFADQFSQQMPYIVHQKNDVAHIVEKDDAWGFAIFNASTIIDKGYVYSVSKPVLIMMEKDTNVDLTPLSIAMADPDLGFSMRSDGSDPSPIRHQLRLNGAWELLVENLKVKILSQESCDFTLVEVTLAHGIAEQWEMQPNTDCP